MYVTTGLFQCPQALNDSHQFHAVVSGVRLAAVKSLFGAVVAQQCAPTALTGIASTGAIGIHLNGV